MSPRRPGKRPVLERFIYDPDIMAESEQFLSGRTRDVHLNGRLSVGVLAEYTGEAGGELEKLQLHADRQSALAGTASDFRARVQRALAGSVSSHEWDRLVVGCARSRAQGMVMKTNG